MSEYRNHNSREVLLHPAYCKHASAMTAEKLHSKGDIAEELALRDMQNETLRAEAAGYKQDALRWRMLNIAPLKDRHRG